MRRIGILGTVTAWHTCLALLVAFLAAPFQHVHTGPDHNHPDHDHAGLIHAHFYHFHAEAAIDEHSGPRMDDFDDDDHADARSLDTFTIELPPALAPFVLPRGPVLAFVPSQTVHPVETVEPRGHDPPSIDRSIPRAPPA